MFNKLTNKIINFVTKRIQPPRIIRSHDPSGSDYLSRYYLVGAPTCPDGSSPYDKYGNPKSNAVWPKPNFLGISGIYIHKFHRSDEGLDLHNHPWEWALSFILLNGYSEERRNTDNTVSRKFIKPFTFNFITSNTFHRVDLFDDEAWSLFITGPKFKGWGFWNRKTNQFIPWKLFLDSKRERIN